MVRMPLCLAIPRNDYAGWFETHLKYRFEPGHILDGVTATIPLAF